MAPDIEAAINLLHENQVWQAVQPYIAAFIDKESSRAAVVAAVNGDALPSEQQTANGINNQDGQQQKSLEGWRGAGA